MASFQQAILDSKSQNQSSSISQSQDQKAPQQRIIFITTRPLTKQEITSLSQCSHNLVFYDIINHQGKDLDQLQFDFLVLNGRNADHHSFLEQSISQFKQDQNNHIFIIKRSGYNQVSGNDYQPYQPSGILKSVPTADSRTNFIKLCQRTRLPKIKSRKQLVGSCFLAVLKALLK